MSGNEYLLTLFEWYAPHLKIISEIGKINQKRGEIYAARRIYES